MPNIVDYYNDYAKTRFKKKDGSPIGKRAAQYRIHEFDLPVIRAGWHMLIDSEAGDEALLRHARRADEPRRGRGRPRKV
jgi:hypothetical protein